MRLLVHLALRSLLRSRLAFGLLVTAVTAGVCFQIPNAANLAGYTEELLRQGMERMTGHLQVVARDGKAVEEVAAILARLERRPHLRAVVPRLIHGGVAFKRSEHQPVRIQGIDPAAEERATGFCRRLGRGRCTRAEPGAEPEAVLGSSLAARLKVGVGDRGKVLTPYQELGEVEHSSAYYLDASSTRAVLRIFDELAAAGRTLVEVVTRAKRVLVLHHGKITVDVPVGQIMEPRFNPWSTLSGTQPPPVTP